MSYLDGVYDKLRESNKLQPRPRQSCGDDVVDEEGAGVGKEHAFPPGK